MKTVLRNAELTYKHTDLFDDRVDKSTMIVEYVKSIDILLQERFVFADMRTDARALGVRFASSFAFNNVEAALRIPVMALMVETWHISSVLATALSLIVAFFARFLFHSLVVYAPQRRRRGESAEPATDTAAQRVIRAIDVEAMKPGEL